MACSGAYDPVFSLHFLKHGYVSIPNFLPPDLFQSLSSALSSALNHSTDLNITWHHQIPNVLGLPPIHFGTRFLDYSFSQLDTLRLNVSNLIASVTASILQPVGGQIAQVIHYTHDPVSLFHYDNDGITSIKWFYFPFEPSSNDSGFLYASGSQRVTDIRSKMLSHMNKSYLDAVPVSNMRPEELDSIYPIHSFNKANSLVIANTAGFHARATVPSGIQRITIQGGTDNTRSFYPQ